MLDGARDGDVDRDMQASAHDHDRADRRLTAAVLHHMNADIVALQEVHDQATLDFFHDRFLLRTGMAPYPWRICLPGNDAMGRNVAVLSRIRPDAVTSHAGLPPRAFGMSPTPGHAPDRPVFCRDCLVVEVKGLTLAVCHFKAPYPDAAKTLPARRAEALAVRRLLERKFPDPDAALWLVVGDLNEPSARAPLGMQGIAPLLDDFAVDLLTRRPQGRRWSYHEGQRDIYSRPDAMLASCALAARYPDACPQLIREGLGAEATLYKGPRLHGVGPHRPHASDHAAVMIDLEDFGS